MLELLAIPTAILVIAGRHDTAIEVAVPVLCGAVAILAALLAVFAAQLLAAPIRQRNELRQRWRRIEQDAVQAVDVELTLRNERRKCDRILASISSRGGCSSEDKLAAENWTSDLIELLAEHVNSNAAREFIEASRNVDGFALQLQARARVLDRIIKRLGS